MSDITFTEAWKKQQRSIGLSASNETVRRLEQQGHMEKGNLHLEALYLSILVEVSGAVADDLHYLRRQIHQLEQDNIWLRFVIAGSVGLSLLFIFLARS